MIAIGGAIGTGLFLGAGGRLAQAGPALVLIYALCGFFAFLVLRAMGELVLHRPSSGSFVSYAREFYGEKAAFTAGWLYWLNWAMTAIVDVTAVALYMKFFGKYSPFIDSVPQWVWALIALAVVLSLNLVSVKVFGEMEFWFALIKVVALVAFLVVGTYFVIFGTPVDGQQVGLSLISDNGGWLPNGLLPAIVIIQGVVFAYASIELIGTTAGETENPEKVMPKAINTVIIRIGIFYVGSRAAAGPAAAVHRLRGRRVAVRDVLLLDRRRRRRRDHEPGRADRRPVLAQRRAVLHRAASCTRWPRTAPPRSSRAG